MSNGVEAFASVEDRGVSQSLQALAALTGKGVGQIIRSYTPTLARYLAARTHPTLGIRNSTPDGLSLAAKKAGVGAVKRDLRNTYVSPSAVFQTLKTKFPGKVGQSMARGFSRAMRNGDFAKAKAICARANIPAQHLDMRPWDGGAFHRSIRKKGRVHKSQRPILIDDAKALKAYRARKLGHVGYAKSGWATAAAQIAPLKGIPAWIHKPAAPGRGYDMTAHPTSPFISLDNFVDYVSDILPRMQVLAVGSDFERSLSITIQKKLDYLAAREARKGGNR